MTKEIFETVNHETIYKLSVTNKNNVTISCLSYGANWYELLVPTEHGPQNLILNFSKVADYQRINPYLNMSIGRTAGRIGHGKFNLNGKEISVPRNEGDNTLHGGPHGFHNTNWESAVDGQVITFTKNITADYDQYPGNLAVKIIYTLTDDNQVLIDYYATADADGIFNPTNHAYFNLNTADQNVKNLTLQLRSSHHLALDEEKIPTGETIANAHTPFDFQTTKTIGAAIDNMQDTDEKGLDDVYLIDDHSENEPIAILKNPDENIAVEIYAERNGIVMFTANKFGAEQPFIDKTGQPYVGVALESQTVPNAVFDPNFGDISIHQDETKHYQTKYQIKF